MSFTPFNDADFQQTAALADSDVIPRPLATKIEDLRQGLRRIS